jgi:hypothetical protein
MIRRKMLADGVMEIRLIGDDGELDAIVELTRPADHSLLIAHLLDWQDEARRVAAVPVQCRVLPFPTERIRTA